MTLVQYADRKFETKRKLSVRTCIWRKKKDKKKRKKKKDSGELQSWSLSPI